MLAVPYTPRALTPAWSTWDLHTWLIPITTNTQGLRCGRWGFSAGLLEGKNVIVAFGFVRLTPTEHEEFGFAAVQCSVSGCNAYCRFTHLP